MGLYQCNNGWTKKYISKCFIHFHFKTKFNRAVFKIVVRCGIEKENEIIIEKNGKANILSQSDFEKL